MSNNKLGDLVMVLTDDWNQTVGKVVGKHGKWILVKTESQKPFWALNGSLETCAIKQLRNLTT